MSEVHTAHSDLEMETTTPEHSVDVLKPVNWSFSGTNRKACQEEHLDDFPHVESRTTILQIPFGVRLSNSEETTSEFKVIAESF